MSLFSIDPDIKQRFIPFSTVPVGQPNIFTFRKNSPTGTPDDDDIRLRICPSQDVIQGLLSEKDSANKDISYRLLFPNEKGDSPLSFDKWLEDLPAIQIREFLQDSRINEIQNMFTAFQEGVEAYKKSKDKTQTADKNCIVEGVRNAVQQAIESKVSNLNDYANKFIGHYYNAKDPMVYAYVMSIPYLLYTKLIASTTQNYYILPYDGKLIFDTDGNYGYSGTGGLKSMSTSTNSIIGKLLNFTGATVRVDTTPRFTPTGDTGGITITVKLDLFNDSLWGAITNFIMINTLFPGNMWMQYHIISHAPNLYDIKVEGYQRLFVCTGKFQCDYKGVMRKPSEEFITNLLKFYVNTDSKSADMSNLANPFAVMNDGNSIIKIPDVYSLTLTFKSLLPNNINNYFYQFSRNDNIVNHNGGELREGIGAGFDFKKFYNDVKGKVVASLS